MLIQFIMFKSFVSIRRALEKATSFTSSVPHSETSHHQSREWGTVTDNVRHPPDPHWLFIFLLHDVGSNFANALFSFLVRFMFWSFFWESFPF